MTRPPEVRHDLIRLWRRRTVHDEPGRAGEVVPVAGQWVRLADDLPWLLHTGDDRAMPAALQWAQLRDHNGGPHLRIEVEDRSGVLPRGRAILTADLNLESPEDLVPGRIVAHWAQPRALRAWMLRFG